MKIPAVDQNILLVDQIGVIDPTFKRFLDLLLTRAGGAAGGSYPALDISTGTASWSLESPVASIVLTKNITIANPANMTPGYFTPYRLTLIQDSAGGHTVTWGSAFKFPSGTPPVLSAGANAVDEFWFSSDGKVMRQCVSALNIS